MLCSEASLVNHGMLAIRVVSLWCRCWSCGFCLPMRTARLVSDVADGLPTKLLTLTTRAVPGGDRVAEARRQGEALARLMRLLRKRCKNQEVAYFAVREATKQGWPHIHVALRCPYVDQPWIKRTWHALTGSAGVDIRAIWKSTNAAEYLAKYIGKDPHRFGTSKRYWHSKNWFDVRPAPEPPSGDWDSKWHVVREHIAKLAEVAWMRGWRPDFQGSMGYFEARAPP